MTPFSQRDFRWSWKKLGYCSTTIGEKGCAITCLGIMTDKRPDEINEILKNNGGFVSGCICLWERATFLLQLDWQGVSTKPKFYPCIADVRMKNGSQHFVVCLDPTTIIDPWDGKTKSNPYTVVSYRNIRPKAVSPLPIPSEFPRKVKVIVPVLNVRCKPTTKSGLCGSKQLHYGDVFTAVDKVVGENIGGNNIWLKSSKGNYVFSGGTDFYK